MPEPETRLSRFEVLIALSIAAVSITTAVVAGRASAVGSAAADATRQGLIDAIRQQAAISEDWRLVYQEAAFAQVHASANSALEVLLNGSDPSERAQASEVAQNLLPSLAQLSPFITEERYRRQDGALDLELRFQDLEAEAPDLAALSPEASFEEADNRLREQRWLVLVSVLLVISLFWETAAEIARGRARAAAFAIGSLIYLAALASLAVIEGIYALGALGAIS
jgi:hypothetical protein